MGEPIIQVFATRETYDRYICKEFTKYGGAVAIKKLLYTLWKENKGKPYHKLMSSMLNKFYVQAVRAATVEEMGQVQSDIYNAVRVATEGFVDYSAPPENIVTKMGEVRVFRDPDGKFTVKDGDKVKYIGASLHSAMGFFYFYTGEYQGPSLQGDKNTPEDSHS